MAIHTLSVPEKLDLKTVEALKTALADVAAAAQLPSAVVFEGASKETFCDGFELTALLSEGDPAELKRTYDAYVDLVLTVRRFSRPVIAVVRGRCLSAGLGLAAACDFLFANADSQFGLPDAAAGMVPTLLWPIVAERMAPQKLRAMALQGRKLTAKSAHRLGLVDALYDDVEMARSLRRYDERLTPLDTDAVRLIKSHSLDVGGLGMIESVRRSRELILGRIQDDTFRHGLLGRLSKARESATSES